MTKTTSISIFALFFLSVLNVSAQKNKADSLKENDFNTPLHLIKPSYGTPYGVPTAQQVKTIIDRVLDFLEATTPAEVIDQRNNTPIADFSKIDKNSGLKTGTFRITSYEWGVTYSGMLLAYQNTGDGRYKKYVADRLNFLSKVAPYFGKLVNDDVKDPQIRQVLYPLALDDAGSICTSMIKAHLAGLSVNDKPLIDNYINYIINKQYRLSDGTLARKNPQFNTLWLDDMYMGIPAIVNMGRLTGDNKYYDEAIRQVLHFTDRMFVKEKGLYRHGWVEGMSDHPAFHWGRANGWALMANVEVLDALPVDYPGREKVLEILKAHIRGLAALQSGEGFWHQLLDKNDSYLETSCTAIYTYCIAHAVNMGWIDPRAYGPVAVLGWNAVASKVNHTGEVEGTCVGTGMGFDPAFYYYRPVHKYAAHGYGPVLLAGGEMIRLLKTFKPGSTDGAVQFKVKDNE